MDKEFVLVSQGIEIMRTKSQENAINYVKEENDKWFDYVQECKDNYEQYADNYIELYVEDEYTKKIEQENKRLKVQLEEQKKINEEHQKLNGELRKENDKLKEMLVNQRSTIKSYIDRNNAKENK